MDDMIAASRGRLLAVLGELSTLATQRSLTRCPYRDRHDVCTFAGGCRNQVREKGRQGSDCGLRPRLVRCSGGPLNPQSAMVSSLDPSARHSAAPPGSSRPSSSERQEP